MEIDLTRTIFTKGSVPLGKGWILKSQLNEWFNDLISLEDVLSSPSVVLWLNIMKKLKLQRAHTLFLCRSLCSHWNEKRCFENDCKKISGLLCTSLLDDYATLGHVDKRFGPIKLA